MTNDTYSVLSKTCSQYTATVGVSRQPTYYITIHVLGTVLWVLMAILSFALDVGESDRMMDSFFQFLAIVMSIFVAAKDVPQVSYLTMLDSFFMVS